MTALGSLAMKSIIQFQGNPALVWIPAQRRHLQEGEESSSNPFLPELLGLFQGGTAALPRRGTLVQHLNSGVFYENISGERGIVSLRKQ